MALDSIHEGVAMKTRFVLLLAVLLLAMPVFSLTVVEKVTPDWTRERGVTVTSEKLPDGAVTFTVTRYMDKVLKLEFGTGGEMTLEHSAFLEVRNAAGALARTSVAGERSKESVVYRFTLSSDCIAHSHFSASEYYQSRDVALPGTKSFEIDLVACSPKPKPLYHP